MTHPIPDEAIHAYDLRQLLTELESHDLRFAEERTLEEPFMFALGWRRDKSHWGFWTRDGQHFYDAANWRPFWKFADALKMASEHLGVIATECYTSRTHGKDDVL